MEIEIETTRTDYSSFLNYFLFQRKFLRKILAVFLISLFIVSFGDDPRQSLWSFIVPKALRISFWIFLLYFFLPYFFYLYKYNKAYKTNESPLGKRKFTTLEDGIKVESKFKTYFWRWETIISAGENKNYIFFLLYNYKLLLIPKSFLTENDADNFLGIIQNGIKKVAGNPKPSSPIQIYWWGLLCLIPGIGAIAGLVLLVRGLVEFKDTILSLIGATGILISIYFFSTKFKDLDNKFDAMLPTMAQSRLNTLMKEIEFYKIQNGHYPQELEEIETNTEVNLSDPLQLENGENSNRLFNYKNLGEKYYLFSSGIDRLPNTADDIYPKVSVTDSSKFGLLKFNSN